MNSGLKSMVCVRIVGRKNKNRRCSVKVSERRDTVRVTGVKDISDSLCLSPAEKARLNRKLKALEARIKSKMKVTTLN